MSTKIVLLSLITILVSSFSSCISTTLTTNNQSTATATAPLAVEKVDSLWPKNQIEPTKTTDSLLPSPIDIIGNIVTNTTVDRLLEDLASLLAKINKFNQEGEEHENVDQSFKSYALNDVSNDQIGTYTPQQIIKRSGYNYENHYVLSDDGYVTQLIRVVNPLADKRYLKQPPVFIMHGGVTSPMVYVWASASQHKPEPYPRLPKHGPMTSWNRSLAFVLANNGYDVWLVGSRGCNNQNQGHLKHKLGWSKSNGTQLSKKLAEVEESFKYFDYTMDDIIKNEIPRQIDRVLELTGAKRLSFMSFSKSTMLTLPLFATQPEYARKIHQHIVMAPVMNNKGSNMFVRALQPILANLHEKVGTTIVSNFFLTHPFSDTVYTLVAKNRDVRYSVVRGVVASLAGPSAKYHTLLEPTVMRHSFDNLGFKEMQHYCQQVVAGRYQKFDYGLVQNRLLYGSFKPPIYDISNQHIANWMLIQAENDNFATPSSSQQIYETIKVKPYKFITAPGFNHLDLVAAQDNDIYVNLPILEYLDRFHLPPSKVYHHITNNNKSILTTIANSESSKQFDQELEKLLAPDARMGSNP